MLGAGAGFLQAGIVAGAGAGDGFWRRLGLGFGRQGAGFWQPGIVAGLQGGRLLDVLATWVWGQQFQPPCSWAPSLHMQPKH